ncbi:MAG TPA: alpha/beta hydrolase [Actinomycetota bacterium]|nr:alpha/beta hydrolase [Actinomycetota bacterium]
MVVEVGGLSVAYERTGSGPPLVLLHGYVGDGPATWRRQLDELAAEFTVVAWDAPGAGRSTDPPEPFSLADYADCLAAFVHALGLERAHVVGLSFGGGLALELYRRHPGVALSLVLAGAYAGWAGSLPPEVVEQRLRQALELSELPPDRLVREVVPTLFSEATPRELVDGFAASMSRFHPTGLRAMARCFADADLRDVLPRIDVPTLLLYGEDDVRAPLDVAQALHAAIPRSRLVVLPGVGHVSCLEAPERFNAELLTFLRSVAR